LNWLDSGSSAAFWPYIGRCRVRSSKEKGVGGQIYLGIPEQIRSRKSFPLLSSAVSADHMTESAPFACSRVHPFLQVVSRPCSWVNNPPREHSSYFLTPPISCQVPRASHPLHLHGVTGCKGPGGRFSFSRTAPKDACQDRFILDDHNVAGLD